MLQGKVWVWGQGGDSAEEDSKLVKPALIAELEDQWPPRGQDGQPWELFGAQYMRDLPYGQPRHLPMRLPCSSYDATARASAKMSCGSLTSFLKAGCHMHSISDATGESSMQCLEPLHCLVMHSCPMLMHHEVFVGSQAGIEHLCCCLVSDLLATYPQVIGMHSAGWATLVENIMDPAHVNFSHHNVIGDRYHVPSCFYPCISPSHASCSLHARSACSSQGCLTLTAAAKTGPL